MIVELVKASIFLFPFIKELFLGKDKNEKGVEKKEADAKVAAGKGRFLRKFLITVAILSVVINFLLLERLFILSGRVVTLKKEVVAASQPNVKPKPPPAPVVVPLAVEEESAGPMVVLPKPAEAAPPEGPRAHRPSRPSRERPAASPRGADDHYDRLRMIDQIK